MEVLKTQILQADETTHKMLEGDKTKNWYLWGFFSQTACYFETKGTRGSEVALEFLLESSAKYLLTDGYSGYGKAIKEIEKNNRVIISANCNAHAYRYYKEVGQTWKEECDYFLKIYGDIYELEKKEKN